MKTITIKPDARHLVYLFTVCLLPALSGCDDFCIGECSGPNASGAETSSPEDNDGAGDGADGTGDGGAIPDLCSYPPFTGLLSCESIPYLAVPLRGTDTVPPNSPHTVEFNEGAWERSTYSHDQWARLQGHLDFQGGLTIPTQGHTHFSIMVATDECGEGWWSETTDLNANMPLPTLNSEVLFVEGKEVLKVEHLVPNPGALTTTVRIVWSVELCDPYVFIVDAEGGVVAPATLSDPGGAIVQNDPGGTFEVIIGMGAVAYGNAP